MTPIPGGEEKSSAGSGRTPPAPAEVLGTFRQTLARETHVLSRRPDLLWQQFFNRIIWEDGAIRLLLRPHLGRRARQGQPPWIRTRLPLPEPEFLIRTLRISRPSHDESRIFLCGFTPDARRVFLGNTTWDAETGQEVPALLEEPGRSWVCGVSPDQSRVVTSDGGLCRVWETSSGREVAVSSAHDFQPPSLDALSAMGDYFLRACAVGPWGRRVVTGCGRFYAVWDGSTGETLASLPGNRFLPACTFSPDGRRVAATDDQGRCFIVDLDGLEADRDLRESGSGQRDTEVSFSEIDPDRSPEGSAGQLRTLEIPSGVMTTCSFSPDGSQLLTGTTEGHAILWDVSTGERLAILPGHSREVLSSSFSPDGSGIVTGGRDGSIRLWEAGADGGSAEVVSVFRGHDGGVLTCAFSPDSHRLVTAGSEGSCKLWRIPQGRPGASGGAGPSETRLPEARAVQAMAFQGHEPRVASVIDGRVTVRNLKTGEEIATLRDDSDPASQEIRSLAFSTYGHRLAVGTGRAPGAALVEGVPENTCTVWDVESEEELAVLEGHTDEVTACAFTPDGLGLVTGSADFYCRVWDVVTSETISVSEKHSSPVIACSVSPCGTRVASASSGACKIWNTTTGRGVGSLYGHKGEVRACAFSPDGSRIVTGSKDGTCKIWDSESRKERLTLRGHGSSVEACTFSSDGLRVLSASTDRTVRVWNAGTGECIGTFPLQGEGKALAHDPEGTFWASGDTSGAVYLTDLVKVEQGPILAPPGEVDAGPIPTPPVEEEMAQNEEDMPDTIDFLAILVFDRGDGWASVQPHVFSASHPEIAYRMALARAEGASGSQRFMGFAELLVAPTDPPTAGEMIQEDPADLVKAKAELQAFQDPRWQGVLHDERELELVLQDPVILCEPEDLDTVRWDRLEHAYGSAQDVPAFLRMLGAEDMEVRSKAFQALVMTIFHQGSLYSATVAAVPFLLRLAINPGHPARLMALELVHMIVDECSFEAYRRHRIRALEEEDRAPGADGSGATGPGGDVVGSIERVLWADIGLLNELARDEDPYLREMAVFIIDELGPTRSRS